MKSLQGINVLYFGNEYQTSLGTLASLSLQGAKTLFIDVRIDKGNAGKVYVLNPKVMLFDGTKMKLNGIRIHIPTLSNKWIVLIQRFLKNLDFEPDIVVTRGSVTFYVGYLISKKLKVPLILHIASIRGLKFPAHIIYGKDYTEIIRFPLSILHHVLQVNLANATVFPEWFTYEVFRKLALNKDLYVIESTFAKPLLYERNANVMNDSNLERVLGSPYVLSIVSGKRLRKGFRIELLQLKTILYIAKKVPEILFAIVGVGDKDLKVLRLPLYANVVPLGWVDDTTLISLYKKALLVLVPVLQRAQSNRFLEAMFFHKATIATSVCTFFYRGLTHLRHTIIEDDFTKYPQWVKMLLINDDLRKTLENRAREYFIKYFSPYRHGVLFSKVIKELVEGIP